MLTVCTREDVARKAKELYEDTLVDELLVDKRGKVTIQSRKEVLYRECSRLSSVFKTPDEELMMRFACSLFCSPDTMISVTQQWQRMSGHTIAPKEYQGEGRIWTTLLHLLVCDANMAIEMVSMFQTYESKVYVFGMESCPMMESLYERGAFTGTCLGEDVVPGDKRVTSPSFLRFDTGYLPTLSGRACLCLLRSRGAFQQTQYRTGSSACAVQSVLRDEVDFIYQTVFDHFRPCVLACMLVSFAWAAYRHPSPFYKQRFSRYVASLLVHIDHVILPMLEKEADHPAESFDERMYKRLGMLRTVLEHFLECEGSAGYSEETLRHLYQYMWERLV